MPDETNISRRTALAAILGGAAAATFADRASGQATITEVISPQPFTPTDAQVNEVLAAFRAFSNGGRPSAFESFNDAFQNPQFSGSDTPVVTDFSHNTNFAQTQANWNIAGLRNMHLFDGVTFEGSNLSNASLAYSSARRANFRKATLQATVMPTDVTGSDFSLATVSPAPTGGEVITENRPAKDAPAAGSGTGISATVGNKAVILAPRSTASGNTFAWLQQFASLENAVVIGTDLEPGQLSELTRPGQDSFKGIITTPEQLSQRMTAAVNAAATGLVNDPVVEYQHLRLAAERLLNDGDVKKAISLSEVQAQQLRNAAEAMDTALPQIKQSLHGAFLPPINGAIVSYAVPRR